MKSHQCFSFVDIKEGFPHIPPDEESSLMTTVHTTYDRYRLLRLPFDIAIVPEEFTIRLASALEGLDGIVCIAEDILVKSEGDDIAEAEADRDHDPA